MKERILLTTSVDETNHKLEDFSIRFAKRWKNYFSLEGLIPNIFPTEEQKQVVQSSEKQLIIRGSAGSGKSLMLVYRLIKIMEQAEKHQRILYVTYNQTLIDDTLKRLWQSDSYKRLKDSHFVNVITYHDLVRRILMDECGYPDITRIIMTNNQISNHESKAASRVSVILDRLKEDVEYLRMEKLFRTHTAEFLQEEFFWMKANGLITLEKYMERERTGRGNSPSVLLRQRPTIFYLFEKYNHFMDNNFPFPRIDMEDYALRLIHELIMNPKATFKYDHILVDEFQDLQPMQIKSLVELTKGSITLVGDEKQRIYKSSPISYKELNLKVNRRTSKNLTKNFRSTKQIMNLASAIEFDDVENVREDSQGLFKEGPRPKIRYYAKINILVNALIREIKAIHKKHREKTIAIIHRQEYNQLQKDESIQRLLEREFDLVGVDKYRKRFHYNEGKKPIFFTQPYEIKGLEFDYVFILDFDRFHYPLQSRVDALNKKYGGEKRFDSDYSKDYDAIRNDEKKILYVACSRAKEELFLMYSSKIQKRISQFVRDFKTSDYESNFKKGHYNN